MLAHTHLTSPSETESANGGTLIISNIVALVFSDRYCMIPIDILKNKVFKKGHQVIVYSQHNFFTNLSLVKFIDIRLVLVALLFFISNLYDDDDVDMLARKAVSHYK